MAQVLQDPKLLTPPGSGISRLDVNQWPKYSRYQRLDLQKKEIRLLTLTGDDQQEDIMFTVSHVSLEDRPVYSALSYCWGAPVLDASLKRIRINGVVVKIKPTLYEFLRTLASFHLQLVLWIDAICINQEDIVERNHQVSIMGEIYSSAETVYAWLGEGNADADYALEYTTGNSQESDFDTQMLSQCNEYLFWRPYWTRMWVIQEFGLAQKLFLVCGQYMVNWQQIVQRIQHIDGNSSSEGWKRFQIFEGSRRASCVKSLVELVLDFDQNRCADRRDKVYALRSLAIDGDLMTVNYASTMIEIFFRLISTCEPMAVVDKYIPADKTFQTRVWGTLEYARKLESTFQILPQDYAENLRNAQSDRIFHWIHYKSRVNRIEGLEWWELGWNRVTSLSTLDFRKVTMMTKIVGSMPVYSGVKVNTGDDVFRLTENCEHVFLLMRPQNSHYSIVDIAISHELIKRTAEQPWGIEKTQLLRRACLSGIEVCRMCTFLSKDM